MKKNKLIKKICIILSIMIFSFGYYKSDATTDRKKTVYLTFNDGPSQAITGRINDLLVANKVKGNFFIVGNSALKNADIIKELDKNGMGIYVHSFSHDTSKVFQNRQAYFKDIDNCGKALKHLTGKTPTNIVRIPSTKDKLSDEVVNEIKGVLKENKVNYINYTINSGDSTDSVVSADNILSKIRDNGSLYKVEVVLMHDLGDKQNTADALQGVINFYKERGYEFKTFDNIEQWEIDYLTKLGVMNY